MAPYRLSGKHAALAVMVSVIWGLNFVVIRVGLNSYPPLALAAMRFTVVAGFGVWFVPRPDVGWYRLVAIGASIGVGQFGFLFVAIDRGMPAGLAAVVLQAQAGFTILFARLFVKERLKMAPVIGLATSACGLIVLAWGAARSVPVGALLLTLCGAASWGLGNIATRVTGATSGTALMVWASIIPPIPLFALAMLVDGPTRVASAVASTDLTTLGAIVYLAVFATYVGFGTWSSLLARYPASAVAPFSLLVPPVGLASAWAFLGERPSGTAIVGSCVVVAGMAYPHLHQRSASEPRPFVTSAKL